MLTLETEALHDLLERAGLVLQRLRRRSNFLDQGRIVLGNLVHFVDCLVGLLDAGRLLAAGSGNVGQNIRHLGNAADDVLLRVASLARQAGALVHLGHRIVDQDLDLTRGRGRALGQGTHLAGHHGKPAALLAGTRRFHRRIQRQDIRLEGNPVDDVDDLDDACRRGLDMPHHLDHLLRIERQGVQFGKRAVVLFARRLDLRCLA